MSNYLGLIKAGTPTMDRLVKWAAKAYPDYHISSVLEKKGGGYRVQVSLKDKTNKPVPYKILKNVR